MPPEPIAFGEDGSFDVVFHFHLGRSAEAEYRAAQLPAVIVSSATHGLFANAYRDAYDDPEKLGRALDELSLLVRAKTGRTDAKPGRIALVAWSAGYGAIRKILATPDYDRIDAVILLDGLHTAYAGPRGEKRVDDRDLEPFARFARDAAVGKKLFVFTHSSIVPVGYASTTETADAIIAAAGGQRAAVPEETSPGGLVLKSRADQGSLHVAGYAGEDKSSHVAHLRLVTGILTSRLAPRWHPSSTPRSTPR